MTAAPTEPEWWDPTQALLQTLPRQRGWSPENNDAYVCSFSWPCRDALAVEWCESRNKPDAFDGYNVGLFQIAAQYHSWRLYPGESLYDPEVNVRLAHEIWSEQSWAPWPACRMRVGNG